ncbi:unnamed protein product [Arabis nemorensis]|uniref:Uncharacterized protein n=1 Tax=Arabis nemorensis TaxID=586526 RepID=A0A565BNS4_9BRAS|nr:unnamed protein product [Arabis nemorensis]
MFNVLIMEQLLMMLVHGHVDICNASPKLTAFLHEDPEGVRLLAKLANISPNKTMSSSSSSALPNTNGPTVNQLQIPIEQQNQLHHICTNHSPTIATDPYDQWSTSNDPPYNNIGAPTTAPPASTQWCTPYPTVAAATEQWPTTHNDLAEYLLGGPTVAAASTDPWPTLDDLAYIRAQTVAQAVTTTPVYPSTLDSGCYIGDNGLDFEDIYTDFPGLQLMQPEKQFPELNGQYQQQLQLQRNFSPEAQQSQQYGGSNGQQYGGGTSIDQQLYHNFDPNQSMQMYTNVDQQQLQGVMLHNHPEIHEVGPDQFQGNSQYQSSETDALSNLDSGNSSDYEVSERKEVYKNETKH